MKTLTSSLFGVLLFVSVEAQAADWTVHYCADLTADDFRAAAKWAFQNRKFVIENDSPSSVIGARKRKKVEIAMEGPREIVIRWVPGFGYHKDNWLKNVRYDVLWGLAGEQKPGEWTIKWCKDLTEVEFHRAVIWAFYKRKYLIEADTGNSVIGGQKEKKVEIAMVEPGRILVRWVPGFGYEKDNWLKNLWRDVSVALTIAERKAQEVSETPKQASITQAKRDEVSRVRKQTPSIGYRIAIFPFAGEFADANYNYLRENETAERLQARIQRTPPLVLAYSYYDKVLNDPAIRNPDRLWTRQRPNLELIYRMARALNVDAIVMMRGDHPGGWGAEIFAAPVKIYLIDVAQKKVYRAKGTTDEKSVNQMATKALADFVQGRKR